MTETGTAEETGTMTADPIQVSRHEGYQVICLNRPEKLNSFNTDMHIALRAALEDARDDATCRAIVLTGAGKGFCAGQDLSDRVTKGDDSPPDLGETIETYYNPLIRLIRGMDKPIICAVNGVAAGAGANIALACDIVLASETVRFIQAFSKIGLVPDSGGTFFLPQLIGEARAKYLMLTGAPLSAADAANWGLIWKTCAPEQLMEEAEALAAHFATAPTFGLGLTKQALHAARTHDLDSQLDLERDLQRLAGKSPDYREGVRAFMEKRAPAFTGRKPD